MGEGDQKKAGIGNKEGKLTESSRNRKQREQLKTKLEGWGKEPKSRKEEGVRQGARVEPERMTGTAETETGPSARPQGQRQDRSTGEWKEGKPQASPPGSLPWLLGQTELKI